MARAHLFEFGDQRWFPSRLRNYATDFLQALANFTKMYQPILPILDNALKESNTNQIIDLGSGGGGGLIWLNQELKKNVPELKFLLTDYYPNLKAFEHTKKQSDNFDFIRESVDARNVSAKWKGLRTLFLSFHHFRPLDAKRILQNAVDSNSSIAIFEAQERSFSSLLAMLFSPLTVLVITPMIRPFSIMRIVFTYLAPILPITIWWDGIVSSLRTYSIDEMNKLVQDLDRSADYRWDIGRVKSGPGVILYLIGIKSHNNGSDH
ncbi:MAG: hypothetical protein ABJF11_06505 [Reichenbachiella sp.]|uniref:hypothetical protein n=1 Tax=Reichenbachiella sp. TaxID=2184521 RepID=UPI003267CFBC